jgi:hypothetical protein
MRPCPRPSIPAPHQLSLLSALTGPGQLNPDERREAVALLAALLIEAASPARPEATDDRN